MSAFPWIFATGFVGLHVAWYWMQQTYVPKEQRHDHPFIKLYKAYAKPKEDDD